MRKHVPLWLAACLALSISAARADPVADGDAAFHRGDYRQALMLLEEPADHGDAVAELDMGLLYSGGNAVPMDRHEAARWFIAAAHQGQKGAMANAGIVYVTGTGVPRNLVQAYMWFSLAVEAGLAGVAGYRDHVATEMTPAEISRATAMALKCKASGYKQCDSVECLSGPVTRTFGGAPWQVFACDDLRSLAFVAASGAAPAPSDFTLSYSSSGTSSAITSGHAMEGAAAAARDEVAALSSQQRSDLVAAALAATPPPKGYGIVGDAAVAAYPPAALAARVSGEAIVTCARDAAGRPHGCRIDSETPVGRGFGAAALDLMSKAAPEGEMQPGQRQALPFHFLFRADPPTITPDVFHPTPFTPYLAGIPTAADETRATAGTPLSGPGGAQVSCWIGSTGMLTGCRLLSETPAGTGWGALALKLAALDRFGLLSREGFPTAGVRITTGFGQREDAPPANGSSR